MASKILDEMSFREMWRRMPEDERQPYLAYQAYKVAVCMEDHEKRISDVENGDKRLSSIAGGISGTITAILVGIINYFVSRRS